MPTKEELEKGSIQIKKDRMFIEIDLIKNSNIMVHAILEAAKGEYIKLLTNKMTNARIKETLIKGGKI